MTIKAFCKIINENTRVRVFDKYGKVGTYTPTQLLIFFDYFRYIIEIKATAFNLVDITID